MSNPVSKQSVVVAHPETQHALQLAVALQDAGFLNTYITRLYTSWESKPFRFLKWLPSSILQKIEGEFFDQVKRSHPELSTGNVCVYDAGISLALKALRRLKLISVDDWFRLLNRSVKQFQKQVIRSVKEKRVAALVGYDTFSYMAFSELNGQGVKLILDQSSVHIRKIDAILKKEQALHPDLAFSMKVAGMTEDLISKASQEVIFADYILAPSQIVIRSCLEQGAAPEKIVLLPYGADIEVFLPTEKREERPFRILYVGRVEQKKGIRYLLEAFQSLQLLDAELWLCGNITDRSLSAASLPDTIKYLGFVPHAVIPDIYRQVDCFVLPTLYDGFPHTCLEAMASGLPVITTTNCGTADLLREGENGFVVPIRDAEALAAKIRFLYDNRTACVEMGRAARKTVEQYTWQHYRRRVKTAFETILETKSGSLIAA